MARVRGPLAVAIGFLLVASCSEPISQVELEDVVALRVTPDSADLPIGRTVRIRAFPLDETGAFLAGQPTEWRSEDASVASVDEAGVVTGMTTGSAEIIVTVGSLEARARLLVAPGPELALSRDSVTFAAVAGEGDPAPETVDVTNGGGFPLVGLAVDSILYDTEEDAWLTADLDATSAPATLTLTSTADGLSTAGDHAATVWLSGFEASNSPASVRAILRLASGVAAALAVNDGDGQDATVGTDVATAPSVLVTDAFGNPVENAEVTFEVTGGDGSVTGETTPSDGLGIARVGSWTLGTAAGENELSATTAGASPVVFTATGTPGPATQVVVHAGDGQSALPGAAVSTRPAVRVLDEFGNGVEDRSVTFQVASGGGDLSGASQTSAEDGTATVGAWTLGPAAGPNTLEATVEGLAGATATFTATALAGDVTGIVYVAGDAQTDTVAATLAVPYAVRVVDSGDNGVEGVSVSWTTGADDGSLPMTSTTDATGLATAVRVLGTAAGQQSAEAAVGGLGSVGFAATALPGMPASVAAVAGEGQSATVANDVPTPPQVAVRDRFANPIAGHEVTFAVTGGGGSALPATPVPTEPDGTAAAASWTLGTAAGPNTLEATADGAGLDGNPVVFTATGTADAPAEITVFAGDDQTAVDGSTVTITPIVQVRDQHGNAVPDATVTFSASGAGSAGSPSTTTNGLGRASSTWTVSATGATVGTDGRFPNTLTAEVQGTALTATFDGFAIYSYAQHVDPLWAAGGCTGCHGGGNFAELKLNGGPSASYAELVNESLFCDATLDPAYRRVSTAGGVDAADDISIRMRMVDSPFVPVGACDVEMAPGSSGMSAQAVAIIRAWIRNGAPFN